MKNNFQNSFQLIFIKTYFQTKAQDTRGDLIYPPFTSNHPSFISLLVRAEPYHLKNRFNHNSYYPSSIAGSGM